MSIIKIFLAEIENKIQSNTHQQKCLFALLTCEKMKRSYQFFHEKTNLGNNQVLDDIIICLENNVLNVTVSKSTLNALYKKLEKSTPNLDDYDSVIPSYAFDCCVVFGEALQYLTDKDDEHINQLVSSTIDTLDMFIQEKILIKEKLELDQNDKFLESKIEQDEFMQRELNRQRMIISNIIDLKSINMETIEKIRSLNNSYGDIIDLPSLYD